jgi:hypothetical protein
MIKLQVALDKANTAKIIMFCSASDQGAGNSDNSYPQCWGQSICIGGATFTGEKLPWVDKAGFLFPGRNVPFPSADGESEVFESGSPVATAAASGLAGVLIYGARLLQTVPNAKTIASFGDRTSMEHAFKKMSKVGGPSFFPCPDHILGQTFLKRLRAALEKRAKSIDIATLDWTEGSIGALWHLLTDLQP